MGQDSLHWEVQRKRDARMSGRLPYVSSRGHFMPNKFEFTKDCSSEDTLLLKRFLEKSFTEGEGLNNSTTFAFNENLTSVGATD